METTEYNMALVKITPAPIFAFLKTIPLIFLSLVFLYVAWILFPAFIWIGLVTILFAWYRFQFIRHSVFQIGPQVIRIQKGIFVKRTDIVQLYRVKDYMISQSLLMQCFQLMDLTLKTTDAENPVIWMRGIPRSDILEQIREYVQDARKTNNILEIH